MSLFGVVAAWVEAPVGEWIRLVRADDEDDREAQFRGKKIHAGRKGETVQKKEDPMRGRSICQPVTCSRGSYPKAMKSGSRAAKINARQMTALSKKELSEEEQQDLTNEQRTSRAAQITRKQQRTALRRTSNERHAALSPTLQDGEPRKKTNGKRRQSSTPHALESPETQVHETTGNNH